MPHLRCSFSIVCKVVFDEIVENFELFDDWQDRYRYVIDLGRDLPELAPEQRTAAAKVDGCASQVWLVPELRTEDGIALARRLCDSAQVSRRFEKQIQSVRGTPPRTL